MPDIGVFTNDIKEDLISGRADLAAGHHGPQPVHRAALSERGPVQLLPRPGGGGEGGGGGGGRS